MNEIKAFVTVIEAINPTDGKLQKWRGPTLFAITEEAAIEFCKQRIGYCKVVGELFELDCVIQFNHNGVYLYQPDIWVN